MHYKSFTDFNFTSFPRLLWIINRIKNVFFYQRLLSFCFWHLKMYLTCGRTFVTYFLTFQMVILFRYYWKFFLPIWHKMLRQDPCRSKNRSYVGKRLAKSLCSKAQVGGNEAIKNWIYCYKPIISWMSTYNCWSQSRSLSLETNYHKLIKLNGA